jgi:hypothetical protein
VNEIYIDSIDPEYIWADTGGAISISSVSSPPGGAKNFNSLPRVYLSSSSGGSDASGVLLNAVALVNSILITAIVPADLAVGEYDIIVIEADNQRAGVGTKLLTVTELPPPLITSTTPKSLVQSSTTTTTINGDYFDTSGAKLFLDCKASPTAAIVRYTYTDKITFRSKIRLSQTFLASKRNLASAWLWSKMAMGPLQSLRRCQWSIQLTSSNRVWPAQARWSKRGVATF